MSLSRCLKKLGIEGHEAAILRGQTDTYRTEGIAPQQAAIDAVRERFEELARDRERLIAEIVARAKLRKRDHAVEAALALMPAPVLAEPPTVDDTQTVEAPRRCRRT